MQFRQPAASSERNRTERRGRFRFKFRRLQPSAFFGQRGTSPAFWIWRPSFGTPEGLERSRTTRCSPRTLPSADFCRPVRMDVHRLAPFPPYAFFRRPRAMTPLRFAMTSPRSRLPKGLSPLSCRTCSVDKEKRGRRFAFPFC